MFYVLNQLFSLMKQQRVNIHYAVSFTQETHHPYVHQIPQVHYSSMSSSLSISSGQHGTQGGGGCSIKQGDTKRLSKLIRKAGSVLGVTLDTVEKEASRRIRDQTPGHHGKSLRPPE